MATTENELLVLVSGTADSRSQRRTRGISGLVKSLLAFLGVIEWSQPAPSADEDGGRGAKLFGGSLLQRRLVSFTSLLVILLLNAFSVYAGIIYLYCYFGRVDHFLRFVSYVCYWLSLLSTQFMCLIVVMKKRFRVHQGQNISWVNIFDESSCVSKLARLKYSKFVPLPKIGMFISVFMSFPVIITATRVIFFTKMRPSCRYWMQYIHLITECSDVFYYACFCYFLYLRRVILEESCATTAAFVMANVGDMEACLNKTRAFFKDYIQLRKLLLPWLSFVLFNATFGATIIGTWSYHLNVFPGKVTMVHPTDAHVRDSIVPVCYYGCDKFDFLQEKYVLFLYNLLTCLRHAMVGILPYIAVSGIDLKYIWERFRMKNNFTITAKDMAFWKDYKKIVDRLHPNTAVDTLFSFVVPLVGFASALLGGRQDNF